MAGDLLVHLVSGMQYVLGINEAPKRAMAMGGILRWKDGRNMPDVHCTLFQYGEVPVYMRLSLGTEMPETYRFQGSKGILELTEFSLTYTPQAGVDTGPSYYASGFPHAMREEYFKKWHQEHDAVPGKEPALEGTTIAALPGMTSSRICGISSRRCGRASRWWRTRCSAITPRWRATWRTNRISARAR